MKKFYIVLIGLLIGFGAGVDTFAQQTWYAINSGDWNDPVNWTLDPAAVLHITEAEGYPLAGDNVVIKSGKTINMPEQTGDTPFAADCNVLTVDGRLDLKDTDGHSFSEIRGTGRVLMEGDNFPDGEASHFIGEGKGTVVFKGGGYPISGNRFYNVEIDLDNTSKVNLAGNLTVDGNFSVLTGNFQFGNDANSRTLTVKGDVNVGTNGNLTVNTVNAFHWMEVHGNFNNEGSIDFSNSDQYAEADNGAVKLKFLGLTNNEFVCDGPSNLYRLFVDKGSDKTFKLKVYADQPTNFNLYGPVNGTTSDGDDGSAGWERLPIVIDNGTLELGANIVIDRLGENIDGNEPKEFTIPETGQLIVNGADVTTSSTTGSWRGITVYGKLTVLSGQLTTPAGTDGLYYATNNGTPQFEIKGGTVNLTQIRPYNNADKFAYTQSGGLVDFFNAPNDDNSSAVLHIGNTSAVQPANLDSDFAFNMSGGKMHFSNANEANGWVSGIRLEINEGNYNVTGGTIEVVDLSGSDKFDIYSTIPLYNLSISNTAPDVQVTNWYGNPYDATWSTDFKVLNNLTIGSGTTFNDLGHSVFIGGDFNIGGTFTQSGNLIFNGAQNGAINNTTGGSVTLPGLYIFKERHGIPGQYYTVSLTGDDNIIIDGTLKLSRGALDVVDFTPQVTDSVVIVNGDLTSSGNGGLELAGTSRQVLKGVNRQDFNFGDIYLNNGDNGAKLASDIDLNNLSFATSGTGTIEMGTYNLTVNGNISNYNSDRYCVTSGNSADGGLTLGFSIDNSTNGQVAFFPVGISTRYSPATINASGQASGVTSGLVTIKPVNGTHPTTASVSDALNYYWKSDVTGFEDLDDGVISLLFDYGDVIEKNFKVAWLSELDWVKGSNNLGKNCETLTFDNGDAGFTNLLSADFTAGKNNPFNRVKSFYSSGDHNWTDKSWLDENFSSTNKIPENGDAVIIQSGDIVTISDDNAEASQVEINGTLKVAHGTSGHVIDIIKGSGRLVYENNSNDGPNNIITGDHTEFCNNKSAIIEFAGTGNYWMPANSVIPYYPNLVISGTGTKHTPYQGSVYVGGDLTVDDANLQITNIYAGELSIGDSLKINTGTLTFSSQFNHHTYVEGSIVFNDAGTLQGGNAENKLFLKGDIDLVDGATINFDNSNKGNIVFEGDYSSSVSIESGYAVVDFYRMYVNKSVGDTVQIDVPFNLNGPTDDATKALVLQSGDCLLNNSGINIDLTTGGNSFDIPSGSKLYVTDGTVYASGNSGIKLDGSLIVNGGTANLNGTLADGTEVNSSYIAFTPSGDAYLEVSNSGVLNVGGQIRRLVTSDEGILNFVQDNGTINIGTVAGNIESSRGMFEIRGDGSSFSQSDGDVITINRSNGSSAVPSLLFNPETVTYGAGSGFAFNVSDVQDESFGVYASQPLNNVTITGGTTSGDGSGNEVSLLRDKHTINGNLSIGDNTAFNANGWDLTLLADMTNEGTYSANGNTTFFNGTADQTISGNTTFFNLEKNGGTGTLNVEDATTVTVNNDLTLLSGVLNTGVNDLNVEGDVTIAEGTSTESNGGNGIVMNSTSPQNFTGGGSIARMMIDNEAGVVVPTQASEITFTEVLKLNDGVLDIGKNLLAFTEDATIAGSGDPATFSAENMIQTNISFTDAGIIKYYPVVDGNNSPYIFTYPIGARGKYTPVVMDVTDNTNAGGSIRVTAADEPHVTVTDPANALNYNWTLDAVNLTGFSAHATMDALATDAPGTTEDYILARIRANDSKWEKGLFENFSLVESNSIARLYFRLENGNISGDYTAGTNDAIPNDVPVYKTIQTGDWSDGNIWERYEDGVATGVTGEVPEGSIVYIKHPVTINVHGRSAFRTIINEVAEDNGILNLGTTLNHRLGAVSGTGKLVVESGSLPAGQYVDFFSADGGTLEYAGNTDYSVLAELPQVNNLTFSGSGQRLLPNLDVNILGDLTIAGGDVINEESRLMTIRGDLSAAGGTFDPRVGDVTFRGSGLQTISGDFTVDVNRSLYNMEVDNTSGITLLSPVAVENIITFTNGVVNTSNGGLLTILNSSNAAVVNASRLRYVNGPMQKKVNGGTWFDFPVGDDYRYGNIGVEPQTTGLWTAQYFDQAPTQTDGVTYVSQNEYWSVRSEVADNAQIKLRWDAESGVNPDNPDFLVITRTTGNWSELSYVDKNGDVSGGTVYTEADFSHSTNERMFTFGSGSIEPFTWVGNATGAPDDWFTPANWTSNLVPSAANPAIVDDTYPTGPDPVIGEGMDAYCSTLEISEGRTVTVLKGATLEVAQSLDNLGAIVLESTNSSLSSLMLPEGATSGDVNVKLTLSANEKFYLSSPVINTSLQEFYPDGDVDADNDFVYVFREEPRWGWIRVNDSYLSDGVKAELGTMEAVAAMYIDGQVLDYGGAVNTSNVIKESDGKGYFLLGNPYPVAIDWEDPVGWERDGFGNTMYSFVTINGIRIYQTYNNGGDSEPGVPSLQMPEGYDAGNVSHIPPYQSVWLRQDVTGPMNITVKPSARVKESDAPLKSASNDEFAYNLIRIKADNDYLFDGTVIYFNENFSESVGDEDSDKRFNSSVEVPELYTRINNRAYAINGLPALSDPQYSIPLSVRNRVEREVTLTVDLSQFNVNYEVFLEDRETGTWTNMREVNTYSYAPVLMGDDHDRFVLHFEQRQDVPTGINESESATDGGIHIYGMGDYTRILISSELLQSAEAVIEVLDMAGRVMTSVTTGNTKTEIELPENNGVYVVRVNAGGTVKTEKVVR